MPELNRTIALRLQRKRLEETLRTSAKKIKAEKKRAVSHYIDPEIAADFSSYYFSKRFYSLCNQMCEDCKNIDWRAWNRNAPRIKDITDF
jgi:hypothetical protein